MAVQFCVVDGRASSRASWANSGSVNGISYVACDFHSINAIQQAVMKSGVGQGVPTQDNLNKNNHEPRGA